VQSPQLRGINRSNIMASFTIVGNNIHSGNRNGSIIFTSTDRAELKAEYMRLAFSRPVAPVAQTHHGVGGQASANGGVFG